MLCSAIGFMLGTGGSALVAMTLGMGERRTANRYFSMIVYVAIGSGIAVSVLGTFFMRPIVICSRGRQYLHVILFTSLNDGLISAVISFLRALVFQLVCVLVLPVLFGIEGIWWALMVAEALACVISQALLLAKGKQYHYL